jgi:hypothetical protein
VPRLSDSFGWPLGDQTWISKVIFQGLILIVPIVGQVALLGWLLQNLDNVRAGRWEMAPAGFHLSRGIGLFGAVLVYGAAAWLPGWLLSLVAGAAARQSPQLAGLLLFLGQAWNLAAALLLLFIAPALVVSTWRAGLAGALDVPAVWRLATADVASSVLASLVLLVGLLIAGLGVILCVVGLLFTTTYAAVVVAGAAAWFDRATCDQSTRPGVSTL